jgi:pimeloyl-ACP methyl ester carboxylesterase
MRALRLPGTDRIPIGRNLVRAISFIALLLSVTCTAISQTPAQATPPMPGTLVDVGGYRVHLYCTGQGSPTVMIVGAAFSFDWALVQPEVASFTRVCTFDPSGTAWSDPFKTATPSCKDRVHEVHQLIMNAHINGPYVLLGYSVGALWARLYAAEYPDNLAGMVIVDHAFVGDLQTAAPPQNVQSKTLQGYHPPTVVTQAPIEIGFQDDSNFSELPKHDQELHAWALSEKPVRPNYEMAVDCFSDLKLIAGIRPFALGDMHLVVISTDNETAGYSKLQTELLGLSRRSEHVVAWNSTHMVPIDAPEVIIESIHKVVSSAR